MPAKLPAALLLLASLLAGCGLMGPPQPIFTVTGQVIDAEGQPVPGAVVSDGEVGTITDDQGRYSLAIFSRELTAVKPGFSSGTVAAEAGRTALFRLESRPAVTRLAIDRRWGGAGLGGLKGFLAAEGHSVYDYPGRALSSLDVLVMVTPGALGAAEAERLNRWVKAGGRLILCGEWGGYPAQDLAGLNLLANPAGITFTGATVKTTVEGAEGSEWLTIPALASSALGRAVGTGGLHLFTCTSLELGGGAMPLFRSDRRTYAVLAGLGPQVLGAVGASGYGKVIALGDSSLWLDEDSAQVGEPNWRRGANGKLASALAQW